MAKGKVQRGKNNKVKLTLKEKRAKKKEKAALAVAPVIVIKK